MDLLFVVQLLGLPVVEPSTPSGKHEQPLRQMSVVFASPELVHLSYMELGMAFGQVLKAHRLNAGFSQEELAFRADMHSTTISLYERGGRQPSLHTVFILADALKLQPADMVAEVQHLKPKIR